MRSALVLVLLSACSAAPVAETVPVTEAEPATTTTIESLLAVATTSTVPPAPTTTTAPSEPYLAGLDLADITARSEDEGRHPRLVWDPVPGATTYTVLVMNPAGEPWWSWSGPETSVVLGGVDTESEIGGPVAEPGVTWVVFAYDADDHLVALSASERLCPPGQLC